MTNQPQTELDEQITKVAHATALATRLKTGDRYSKLKRVSVEIDTKALKALITQREIEARIDELEKCCEECGYWHTNGHNSQAMTFSERIAELTSKESKDD